MNTLEQSAEQHYSVMPINRPLDEPVSEQHDTPIVHIDNRPIRLKMPDDPPKRRALNRMCGSNGVDEAWRDISDATIRSSFAATQASLNSQVITLPNYAQLKMWQWPDATVVYMVIRAFSVCPTVATATGELQCYFTDYAGRDVPLGDFPASTGGNLPRPVVCGSPITDSGLQAIGTLFVNWLGGAAGATLGYQFGISFAYLLPSRKPYEGGNTPCENC